MSTLDLDAIEKRAEAATKGPWEPCKANDGTCECGLIWSVHADDVVATTAVEDRDHVWTEERAKADRDFIAAARTDVPALVSLARTQQERIRELEETLRRWEMSSRAMEE